MFDSLGFSLEIGALIAGMSLASSKYTLELSGKIKPLRDFFVVLFFVFFGSQLAGEITSKLIYQSLVFSLFIIVGKPIIVMSFLRLFGYKKRTNFLAGSSLAQISEFSLIIVLLGFTIGHLTQETMSLVILISIITITVSSYSIYYSHWIFSKISHLLNVFEGKKEEIDMKTSKDEIFQIVVIGYHRIGYKILKSIRQLKMPFIVIDHNPKVILALRKKGINCIYGDAGDKYLLSEINLENAKLVISTIPEENSNLVIKERLKEINSKAVFIATAEQPRIALELYNSGVDYVIVPHHLGGDYIAEIIKDLGLHKGKYEKLGKTHYKELSYAKNKSKYS
ncbi:NAD-binding protein [Candidatus Pacearchaeota archaeon]|nr:NAD-binding protein [Candidatus Pacearchaeota archaeon]